MKQVTRLSMLSLAFVIAAVALVIGAVGSAAAVTCTDSWDGGATTLSWQDAGNWTTNVLPGASDNVCLSTTANVTSAADVTILNLNQSAGSLTISGGAFSLTDAVNSSSATNLTLSGGALGGAATLTTAGAMTWSGGEMMGSGTTSIASGRVLTINGAGNKYLGRTLSVLSGGSAIETGSGSIGTTSNGSPTINVAGTYDVQTDVGVFVQNIAGQINVLSGGVFKKSAGTGTSNFDSSVDNDGSVQALSGMLSMTRGSGAGHSSTGSFSATAGNTLQFGGDTQDMSGTASVSGAGVIQQTSGTTTFAGATWNVTGQTNEVNGGLINFNAAASTKDGIENGYIGGSATYTITGNYSWQSGEMLGTGTTAVASTGVLTLNGASNKYLGRTLSVLSGGSAIETGSGSIGTTSNGSPTINVAGTYDVQTDVGVFVQNIAGHLNVLSGGVFKKSAGTGISGFNIIVTNGGAIDPLAGTLSLQGGLTNAAAGHLNITAGGILSTSGAFSNLGTIGVEISGASPGTTGQIHFTGAAPFAGTLAITRTGSTPALNQIYTFATYTSHSGKFKFITGQSIAATTMAYLVTLGTTSATLTVRNSADTSLTGTFPAAIAHSTAYSYVYVIHNSGPMPATKIIFTDSLPVGVTFVSATTDSGTCTTVTTTFTKVTCKPVGSLAIGATVNITINVTSPGVAGTVTNKPSVKSFEADVSMANNALTQKTTVS